MGLDTLLEAAPDAALPTCVMQVSCLALSKSGRYLASGQITYMGFTADIIVWDLETRQLMHRLALHKVQTGCASSACARTCANGERALLERTAGTRTRTSGRWRHDGRLREGWRNA